MNKEIALSNKDKLALQLQQNIATKNQEIVELKKQLGNRKTLQPNASIIEQKIEVTSKNGYSPTLFNGGGAVRDFGSNHYDAVPNNGMHYTE